MRRTRSFEIRPLDPEIERTIRQLRRERRGDQEAVLNMEPEHIENAPPIPIRDRTIPVVDGFISCIVLPPLPANACDIKTCIQMIQQSVQFGGSANEDPNAHISNFLEVCGTFNYNRAAEEAMRLRVFPYSLKDRAKAWLQSLPAGSITTWNMLVTKFLAKYFPPARTAKLRNDITSFVQQDSESLCEAWERYKDLLRKCPHHEIAKWLQVQTFYNGLSGLMRTTIDAAAGGALMAKGEDQAWDLIEEMANNNSLWPTERSMIQKLAGIYEVGANTAVNAKLDQICKYMETLTLQGNSGSTSSQNGGETANYVNNFNRQGNNPYSNTYNPGWRNHPNFSWSNNQGPRNNPPPGFNQPNRVHDQVSDPGIAEVLNHLKRYDAMFQNQSASIKALENQIGQLANAQSFRPPGNLPSNTEPNPRNQGKEQVQAITLKSGTEINKDIGIKPTIEEVPKDAVPQKEEKEANEKDKFIQPPPFPQRLQKNKLNKKFAKFLEVFKQLHINIPFAEALEEMPSYLKFMKNILSRKRRLEDYETVALTEECSAIIQRKLPPKLKDPGSFNVPCTIGEHYIGKALCDLGASVNLMPFSIFRKLQLGEAMPTSVSLQLADRTLAFPRGVVENVLVKIDKLIFPADFIILDMEEDKDVPIILGRPFLATGRTVIDVQKGELTMKVEDQEVTFNVFKAMKFPDDENEEECFRVDIVDGIIQETDAISTDKLEACISNMTDSELDAEIMECINYLDKHLPIKSTPKVENLKLPKKDRIKPSIEEPPQLELKLLPNHLSPMQCVPKKGETSLLGGVQTKAKHHTRPPDISFQKHSSDKTQVLPYETVELLDNNTSKTFKRAKHSWGKFLDSQRVKHYWGESFDRQKESVSLSDPA